MTSNKRATMPDAAERLVRRIRSGADGSLDCRELVFAGNRIEEPERNDLADELAAFANASGGVLILGLSRGTGCVTGVRLDALDEVMQYVREVARSAIDPSLLPVI